MRWWAERKRRRQARAKMEGFMWAAGALLAGESIHEVRSKVEGSTDPFDVGVHEAIKAWKLRLKAALVNNPGTNVPNKKEQS